MDFENSNHIENNTKPAKTNEERTDNGNHDFLPNTKNKDQNESTILKK